MGSARWFFWGNLSLKGMRNYALFYFFTGFIVERVALKVDGVL